jgi:hypothetical protein
MQKTVGAPVFRITHAINGGELSIERLLREYKMGLRNVVIVPVDREKIVIQCLCGNKFFVGNKKLQLISFFQQSTRWGKFALGTTEYRLLVETDTLY